MRISNAELEKPSNKRYGWTFAPGDKVMQTESDYDKQVYNDDIATSIRNWES